jgi:hypothetical protein
MAVRPSMSSASPSGWITASGRLGEGAATPTTLNRKPLQHDERADVAGAVRQGARADADRLARAPAIARLGGAGPP